MTSDFLEIDGPAVKAKQSEHESGQKMIVFLPFIPKAASAETFLHLIETAKTRLGVDARICRICLVHNQIHEREILEKLGFMVDGFEYGLNLAQVSNLAKPGNAHLPDGYFLKKMHYEHDIDAVVALEKEVHSADQSTRVNFDSLAAVESMKRYYQRAAGDVGVFLLMKDERIIGVLGFLPDRQRDKTIHISSVSIAVDHQGKGLFFAYLLACLSELEKDKYLMVTGVTTTAKLIALAKKYCVDLLSVSLSRDLD